MAAAIAALAMLGALGNAHATFPGENGVIVFESVTTLGTNIGKTAPISGSPITYLALGGRSPVASPSGKRVVYAMPNAANNTSTIHVMNIAGTNDVQLTSGAFDSNPVWTPDGKNIAFIRDKSQLWIMNADGTSQVYVRPLAASPFEASDLAWAPDYAHSALFAYAAHSPTAAPAIYQGLTGSTSDAFVAQGSYPSYSPNGSSMLYRNAVDEKTHEINTDGSNDHLIPGNGLAAQNVISPDGTVIAGGFTNSSMLTIRPRTSSGANINFDVRVNSTDWSRVPRNCLATTSQGGTIAQPGGAASADFYASQCAIVYMPDASQVSGFIKQAVAIGPDGLVYHSTLGSASGATWSTWQRPAGVNANAGGMPAKKIALAGAKDGSLQVVVVATDDNVYHTVRYANGSWQANGFQPVLNGSQGFAARDVAITINADSATSQGNAQIVANGKADGSLHHIVRSSNGAWSPWAMPPGATGVNTNQLAIAAAPDGNTYVLATVTIGSTASIQRQVRYGNGTWDSSFVQVALPGPTGPSDVALSVSPAGAAQLMYINGSGAWLQERNNPQTASAWTVSVPSVLIAPDSTAASISAPPSGTAASAIVVTQKSAQ